MKPIAILTAAVLAAALVPVAAEAQSTAYYVATPAAAPAKETVITRSTLWRARGPAYLAQRAPERPAILCRMLADRAGPLSSFSADGKPFDPEALADCNAKVAAAPQTVAAK